MSDKVVNSISELQAAGDLIHILHGQLASAYDLAERLQEMPLADPYAKEGLKKVFDQLGAILSYVDHIRP